MNSSQKTGQPSLWHLIMYPKKYVHILYQAGLVTCCKLKFHELILYRICFSQCQHHSILFPNWYLQWKVRAKL